MGIGIVAGVVAVLHRDLGEVLNAAGTSLLTVIPVAKSDDTLTVDDVPLKLRPLPYGLI